MKAIHWCQFNGCKNQARQAHVYCRRCQKREQSNQDRARSKMSRFAKPTAQKPRKPARPHNALVVLSGAEPYLNFGKYAYKAISTVPTTYLLWLIAQDFLPDKTDDCLLEEIARRKADLTMPRRPDLAAMILQDDSGTPADHQTVLDNLDTTFRAEQAAKFVPVPTLLCKACRDEVDPSAMRVWAKCEGDGKHCPRCEASIEMDPITKRNGGWEF